MKYRVEPIITEGCDCQDCKAGRHLYLLYRLPATGYDWSAMSMQSYSSAADCKQNHWWGLDFSPQDTWEDGTTIVVPEPRHEVLPEENGLVPLDANAFEKSAEAIKKYWRG